VYIYWLYRQGIMCLNIKWLWWN